MIIEVDNDNVATAAMIHSASWADSHRSFCSEDFIGIHSSAHQEAYLRSGMLGGKSVYMLVDANPLAVSDAYAHAETFGAGRPVGIVSITENLIEDLYVLPDEQHKGFGTQLLMFAMRRCRGVPTLWILENNVRAYSLYSKYGFCKTGRRNRLSDSLWEIEMARTGVL